MIIAGIETDRMSIIARIYAEVWCRTPEGRASTEKLIEGIRQLVSKSRSIQSDDATRGELLVMVMKACGRPEADDPTRDGHLALVASVLDCLLAPAPRLHLAGQRPAIPASPGCGPGSVA